ncbi:hypothetical protein KR009_007162 [Drosophila setifemur]|nr:hypothetical protein KR009_007162 [Drosophila setifemur]
MAIYSPGVKVGNWLEYTLADELNKIETKKNRDSGQQLVDRTRAIYERLHQDVVLGPPQEVFAFGGVVQLKPLNVNICRQPDKDLNLALSVVITQEGMYRNYKTINELCELTVAPGTHPSVRNSFRIMSPNEQDRSGQYLTYGEKFRLQPMEPVDEPLYLFSGPKRLNLGMPMDRVFYTSDRGEQTLPLGLISHKNCGPNSLVPTSHTHFFCAHEKPDLRFESVGHTIPVDSTLVIVHAVTNRNLAVENTVANTLFGPEFQVSVQTYKNVFKRETWKNLWKFAY